jgi:hypothetical protein
MQAKDPPQNLITKEKTQWSTNWAGLPKSKMSTEPIVTQSLSIILSIKLCLWNKYSKISINKC